MAGDARHHAGMAHTNRIEKSRASCLVNPVQLRAKLRELVEMTSTEQTRVELFDALSELSRIRPEWRLGQTMANLATTAGRLDAGGVWDLEDEEALAAARTLIEQHSKFEGRAATGEEQPVASTRQSAR